MFNQEIVANLFITNDYQIHEYMNLFECKLFKGGSYNDCLDTSYNNHNIIFGFPKYIKKFILNCFDMHKYRFNS